MYRSNLWDAALFGNAGNDRWQCERAAKHLRNCKEADHTHYANQLESWAEMHGKCEVLSDAKIWSASRAEIQEGVSVLLDEFGTIPGPVKPRLCVAYAKFTCEEQSKESMDMTLFGVFLRLCQFLSRARTFCLRSSLCWHFNGANLAIGTDTQSESRGTRNNNSAIRDSISLVSLKGQRASAPTMECWDAWKDA